MVGTAVGGFLGGPLGARLDSTAGRLAQRALGESEFEGEFELEGVFEGEEELEGEWEAAPLTQQEALAEYMATVAARAQTDKTNGVHPLPKRRRATTPPVAIAKPALLLPWLWAQAINVNICITIWDWNEPFPKRLPGACCKKATTVLSHPSYQGAESLPANGRSLTRQCDLPV